MKTSLLLLSTALALVAVAPAAQAYAGPYRDLNPCGSGFGADAVVGDVCADLAATDCNAWIEWTAIPAPPTCLATVPAAQASLGGPDMPDCYMVYSRYDVGQYTMIRRTSCSPPEFYVCPYEGAPLEECDPLLQATSTASANGPEPQCLQIYREYRVGPVLIVSPNSCESHVYFCGQPVRGVVPYVQADPVGAAECTVESFGLT